MAKTVIDLRDRSKWLSTGDVRRLLGISNQAVNGLVQRGRLPFQDTAAGRMYDREDVERLKTEREAKSKSAQPDADPESA